MTVTSAFFFMYLTGKVPLIVAGTSLPTSSRGVGVTVKFSSVSLPSLLQDDSTKADAAAIRKRNFVLFIVLFGLFDRFFGRKDTKKNEE